MRGATTSLRSATRVLLSLGFTSVLAGAAGFAAQIIAARLLGVVSFGAFAAALSAAGIVTSFVTFGVGRFWLRVFGEEGHSAVRWILPSLVVVGITSLLSTGAFAGWAMLAKVSDLVRDLALLLLPVIALWGVYDLVNTRLQLEERYAALSAWQAAPSLMRLGVVLVLLGLGGTAATLAAGYSGVAIALGVLSVASLWRMERGTWTLAGHGKPETSYRQQFDWKLVWETARSSFPYAMSALFYLIYYQSDIVLLAWLSDDSAAGLYQVAFVLVSAAYLPPLVLFQKYLQPKIHRWACHDQVKYRAVYGYGVGLMAVGGLIAGIAVYIAGPALVSALLGADYDGAGPALRVLSVAVPAHYVASAVGSMLVRDDHVRMRVRYQGATALLNIGINVAAIPSLGIVGAAGSTVLCEWALALMYYRAVRRHLVGSEEANQGNRKDRR